MGIDLQPEFAYKFIYKANLDGNLIEHEYDHVFVAKFDGEPIINKEEVEQWKYSKVNAISEDALSNPGLYTFWFQLILVQDEFKSIIL